MNIIDCIGKTPLLKLDRVSRILEADIRLKAECFNPGGSIQDRLALACIRKAEGEGRLNGPRCFVEAVDENFGISLAMLGLKFDLRFLFCIPEYANRRMLQLMKDLGAEIILTPAEEGFAGALRKAAWHRQDTWGSYRPEVFSASSGFASCHYEGAGAELVASLEEQDVEPDAFVCPVWSGNAITGIGRHLREKWPGVRIVAVEPASSPVLSGGMAGRHCITGMGSGVVPDALDRSAISEVIAVSDEDALGAMRRLQGMEGIIAGPSSGACLFASLLLAKRPGWAGKSIVTLAPDSRG